MLRQRRSCRGTCHERRAEPQPRHPAPPGAAGGRRYNFYDKASPARAGDLSVRQRASDALMQAAQTLRLLEADYRRRFLPPATRDQPYPSAEVMAKLRRLGQWQERLGGLESGIRGMGVPA